MFGTTGRSRVGLLLGAGVVATALVAGCGSKIDGLADGGHGGPVGHSAASAEVAELAQLPGQEIVTLSLPGGSYTPSAPEGATDDYRCFVLDLPEQGFATGFQVIPGNPELTHHAILYRIYPEQVADAGALEAADDRPGYECFGGSGVPARDGDVLRGLDESDWITAWAPGGEASDTPDGYGVPIPAGGKVVLQMHYNTRVGTGSDSSMVKVRMAPEASGLKPLYSMLMPAPVELPCPADGPQGPLCDRQAAIADVASRFGRGSAAQVYGLQALCGGDPGNPAAGATQSCTRTVREESTLFAVAGHMHLLGASITVDVANPDGTQRVLDVPQYDFDNQDAVPLAVPMQLRPGDEVTVTCTHDPTLRGKVPGIPAEPRYVVWGEGTTDEMCLGVLIIGKDA